jgi:FdhE protein
VSGSEPYANQLQELLDRRVSALLTARPDLEPILALQAALLREALTETCPPDVRPNKLDPGSARSRLKDGVPLLDGQPPFVDLHYAADLFERLLNVVLRQGDPDTHARAAPLIAAAADGRLEPRELFTEMLLGHQEHLAALADAVRADSDFLLSLTRLAVAPLLRAYATHLATAIESLADEVTWLRGYCPVCGGAPLLGELRGVELRLFLRCSACGFAWRSRRLFCPFCENDDSRSLGTLHVEGDHRFRVQVCDGCRGYLKVGNAFDPPPAELLALDDLASLDLDLVAIERGYARPNNAGFRLAHPTCGQPTAVS